MELAPDPARSDTSATPPSSARDFSAARGWPRGSVLPTAPPEAAVPAQRATNAPSPGAVIPSHYEGCFGCGSQREHGLAMTVIAGDGVTLRSTFTVTQEHQGAPGLAHGGVLAAAFDETLGALNWLLATPSVTGRLELDYRRPVPVGSTLLIDAEIVAVHGRKVFTRAVGRLDSPDGALAVTAAAMFIQVGIEHFTTHGRREDIEAAGNDRAVRGNLAALELNP